MRCHVHGSELEVFYQTGVQRHRLFHFRLPLLGCHPSQRYIGGVEVSNPDLRPIQLENKVTMSNTSF